MLKFRTILIIGIIILTMVNIASASIRPAYVETDRFGMEPAEWLAVVVGFGALIHHIGRYMDKKAKDPTLKYDKGYLITTSISILAMCQLTLQVPVVELGPEAVIAALILGLGGNEGINRATKVVK